MQQDINEYRNMFVAIIFVVQPVCFVIARKLQCKFHNWLACCCTVSCKAIVFIDQIRYQKTMPHTLANSHLVFCVFSYFGWVFSRENGDKSLRQKHEEENVSHKSLLVYMKTWQHRGTYKLNWGSVDWGQFTLQAVPFHPVQRYEIPWNEITQRI